MNLVILLFLMFFWGNVGLSQGQEGDSGLLDSPRFRYNSEGRRDPFMSFVRPDEELTKWVHPLQKTAIPTLKLIGVASSGGGGYEGMIQVPDGKSYPVKRGARIGMNQGRIRDIGPTELIVEEPYLNIFGRSDIRQTIMKLYTKKEGVVE